AVVAMDSLGESTSRIDIEETDAAAIGIDDLHVAAPAGAIRLSEDPLKLEPRERVLFAGERGVERTLLFRALIGIWPWGSGRITRSKGASLLSLPARASVPPGTLRTALCYPCATREFDDASAAKALAAVGLERFQPQLDTPERWDRQLNDDEK